MKRFWKSAQAIQNDGSWGVELDGRPLRTPARKPVSVPTQRLAEDIAAEWNAAEDKQAVPDIAEHGKQQRKNQQQGNRHHDL